MNKSSLAMAVCATSVSLLLSGCSSDDDAVATPSITTQPASLTIATDTNGTLSVVASGSNVTYQWYKDSTLIAGATAAFYTATEAGTYYVVVTDSTGTVTSANAVITVTGVPVVTTQPTAATILTGSSQTLTVEAAGAGLSYQWYLDGAQIAGATGQSYVASAQGAYTVTVTNTAGTTTSASAMIQLSSTVTTPVISTQPAAQTVNAGTTVKLSVAASGTSLSYQWNKDGAAIAGATGPVYTIDTVSTASAGVYTVVVTNTAGAVTSAGATLTVNASVAGSNTASVVNAASAV